jgi:hypothetical protein
VETPHEDQKPWEDDENEKTLDPVRSAQYSSFAARCNYIAPDRPDIMYTTKEICRQMANPTIWGMKLLKRLGGIP